MNEKYTENKGCAGLRSNPAHPLFSGFFHRQCVSHTVMSPLKKLREKDRGAAHGACCHLFFEFFSDSAF